MQCSFKNILSGPAIRSFIIVLLVFDQGAALRARTRDSPDVRIGLSLSGGAALGLAHIGVLKVLEREGISIACITGNSMGAMVGGAYAAGYSAVQIESLALAQNWTRLFSFAIPFGAQYLPERKNNQRYVFELRHRNMIPSFSRGLIPLENVQFLLMDLLSETEYNTNYDFDSLPIPFRALAVDLVSGKKVVLSTGRLDQAIRASIAIPGVFAPEVIDTMELVDGGVQQYLPVYPLLNDFDPDFVIAVLTMKRNRETGISLIDVISRTMDVISYEDLEIQKELADVLIEPDVDPFRHSDFYRTAELIAAGEKAAENALPALKEKLAGLKLFNRRNTVSERPPVLVNSIKFQGRQTTREHILRSVIKTREGKYLDFKVLQEDLVRLYSLGFFEEVDYRIEFVSRDWADITILLKEKAFGFYLIGIHYDNRNDLTLGLEIGQGNLWGSGASIRGVLNIGNPNEYRVGITGTRLFMLPFGYRIDAYYGMIDYSLYADHEWSGDYTKVYKGGIAEAGYILGRDAFFNIGMKTQYITYRSPQTPEFSILPAREWMITPQFAIEFNNCDNTQFPSNGLIYELSLSYSEKKFGADSDYIKISTAFERIQKISNILSVRYGLIWDLPMGRLPWSEWSHTGGRNFIGFTRDEFTTENRQLVHIGCDFKIFHLLEREDYPVYLQTIFNAGSFLPVDTLASGFDMRTMLDYGAGIGVLTNTPVGPSKLMFGIGNPGKAPNSMRFNVFISVGRDFFYWQ